MKIEAYIILKSIDHKKLEKEVNEFIENGFVPLGNLTVAIRQEELDFVQAMVKYEENSN